MPNSDSAKDMAEALGKTCQRAEAKFGASSLATSPQPFIVLAFDEAHTLTSSGSSITAADDITTTTSSPLAHLRRALRKVGPVVFSVFLSTNGNITQLNSSSPQFDPSDRVAAGEYTSVPSFTALGWDHLVRDPEGPRLSIQAGFNFKDIGFEYQVKLGRPL